MVLAFLSLEDLALNSLLSQVFSCHFLMSHTPGSLYIILLGALCILVCEPFLLLTLKAGTAHLYPISSSFHLATFPAFQILLLYKDQGFHGHHLSIETPSEAQTHT